MMLLWQSELISLNNSIIWEQSLNLCLRIFRKIRSLQTHHFSKFWNVEWFQPKHFPTLLKIHFWIQRKLLINHPNSDSIFTRQLERQEGCLPSHLPCLCQRFGNSGFLSLLPAEDEFCCAVWNSVEGLGHITRSAASTINIWIG